MYNQRIDFASGQLQIQHSLESHIVRENVSHYL